LLIETDSPFLAPEPMRGKTNEPSFIIYTAQKLADLRSTSLDEIKKITTKNFNSLFFNK
jgi:TatD DNase family protein